MTENKKRTRVAKNITEGKRAPAEPSHAIGLLLQAQEEEREQIARLLHDELGSSLSILGIELFGASRPASEATGQGPADFLDMYKRVQELGSQVSRLSNQLRPPMLKYFGLEKALEAECSEFTKTFKIPASCSCNNVPAKLNPDTALSFLRVVQEALRNAGNHSQANTITIALNATATELTLTVSDNGTGFDMEQTQFGERLGLICMRERMRLIGGEFEIWSQPGHGTKVSCRAPLRPEQK